LIGVIQLFSTTPGPSLKKRERKEFLLLTSRRGEKIHPP
jgi:hypothetical protein